MIKCIIVEDETLAQQVIQSHLQKMEEVEVVAVCNNAAEAIAALKKFEVDLIFLDIQLPGVTGLSLLKILNNPPLVILTTAYSEYALESYEFSVIDYLLKPISFERFKKAMTKVFNGRLYSKIVAEKDNQTAEHIFIKSGNKFFKINFSEIIFIEAMKDYLKIHAADYTLVTHQTMTEMEKLLPAKQFIRVHKSFIVAVAHIKTVYGNNIELEKNTIPIGVSYKNSVMNFIAGK
ncbi:MAG TPA: LytTR family DNA-binding domain-containing protein [Puia sp.]|nr:LytTR family DNA-binding domain-containing protein [Puia sp.]